MAMAALEHTSPAVDTARFLEPGRTCWRLARAERAAVLIDGDSYFGALRSAILKARHSIFILGWDIDSRARLCAAGAADADDPGAPDALGALLAHVVLRRPELQARLLLWNYSILYAGEREPLQSLTLGWATPPQIELRFDDALPFGASHHQKIVVIDDRIAFCGGMDVTSRRWDTSAHDPRNPDRVDPRGVAYRPFHDIQMVVDGEAARTLSELVRYRWKRAASWVELPPPCPPRVAEEPDAWPSGVAPHFTKIDIGIARTFSAFGEAPAVREVEELYLRSIAAARRHIYIENQYLTSDSVADTLCRKLREEPRLEVVVVAPKDPKGWLEARSMWFGRARFRRCLTEAGVFDRVRLLHPFVRDGEERVPVMVHAKVMIVDDRFLRVGSSNLNNRSMGLDSECDLGIEAHNAAERRAIAALRDRLLGEHLGVAPAAVSEGLRRHGSLRAVVDTLRSARRGLAVIDDEDIYDDEIGRTINPIADPERPIEATELAEGMFGSSPRRRRFGPAARLFAGIAVVVGLVLAWQVTPLAELADPAVLGPRLDAVAEEPWAPFALVAAFVLGGLIVFPLTVLIAVTAIAFGPFEGMAYAAIGSLLSAAVTHQIGRFGGRRWLASLMGPRIERVRRRFAKQGILSIVILRMVPVAPFTLVNLLAGASDIRFRDYLAGTALGLAPGIVMMTTLGDRLRRVWEDPSWIQAGILLGVLVIWLGVTIAIQRAVSRHRG